MIVAPPRRTRLSLECAPVDGEKQRGDPIPIRCEITNRSTRSLVLRGMGIPWESLNMIRFRASGEEGFETPIREGLPRTVPDVELKPDQSVVGEIDLAQELVGPDGSSVAEHPGDYGVIAEVTTFVARRSGEDELVQLESEPFTVRIVEAGDAG
jgi:hypothetical protein